MEAAYSLPVVCFLQIVKPGIWHHILMLGLIDCITQAQEEKSNEVSNYKWRNFCLSVCLCLDFLCNRSSDLAGVLLRTQGGAVSTVKYWNEQFSRKLQTAHTCQGFEKGGFQLHTHCIHTCVVHSGVRNKKIKHAYLAPIF